MLKVSSKKEKGIIMSKLYILLRSKIIVIYLECIRQYKVIKKEGLMIINKKMKRKFI